VIRFLRLASVALLGVSASVVLSPQAAFASTCGTEQNNQVGWASNPAWTSATQPYVLEGVAAYITPRIPSFCTSPANPNANFSEQWTMIFGEGNEYVQSGMYVRPDLACKYEWSEQGFTNPTTHLPDFQDEFDQCVTVNGTYRWWQQSIWTGSAWRIRSNVNSNILYQTTSYGVPDLVAEGDVYVAFDGETYYSDTDVPGTSSARSENTSMQVQRYSDDTWHSTCSNVTLGRVHRGNTTRYGNTASTCDHIAYWTN
jgi:hypothetical protein